MKKSFRCGRLMIQPDGKKKVLKISQGGGIRNCPWESIDMNLHETHQALRTLFGLDPNEQRSTLYDFQQHPLDNNQYRTFLQYVQAHGLKFNNTLIYLATPQGDPTPRPTPVRKPTPVQSPPVPVVLTRVEADSSTPPVLIKIDDEPTIPTNRHARHPSPVPYARYSFDRSLNDLVQYLRTLIVQSPREEIFLKLFEDVCTLRGLGSIVLDRLKQEIESSKINRQTLYNETLEKIQKLTRTIKVSIDLNKMTISQYSTLVESIAQFEEHFQTLHHRWENFSNSISTPIASTSTSIPTPSTSTFTFIPSTPSAAPIPSTSSSTAAPSTSTSTRISSTSRSYSNSRSRSSRRSQESHRETSEDKRAFLHPLKKPLSELLHIVDRRGSSSFYYLVRTMIREIQSCSTRTNLKEKLYSIEKRLSNKINEQHRRQAPYPVHRELQHAADRALDTLRHLLRSCDQSRRPTRHTRWSTPPPPATASSSSSSASSSAAAAAAVSSDQQESKPIVHSNAQPSHHLNEDDLSSEASHSSFGDEVLMEVARTAYEHRPRR